MSDPEMARTGPEMTVAEQAMLDVQKGLQAMAKRAQQLGKSDPTVEEITDYDRRRFGMAVRFEVDVCIPLPDLKRSWSGRVAATSAGRWYTRACATYAAS
jgi:hypothetical protein